MRSYLQPSWMVVVAGVLSLARSVEIAAGQQPGGGEGPAASAPPTITAGAVTLPYTELKTLWEAAQIRATPPIKVSAPPVAFSVQSARYEISLSADLRQAFGQAAFEVVTFAEGWTAIPLLPAKELRLSSVEPAGTLVTVREGVYTLLSEKPIRQTVTLRFSMDLIDGTALRTHVLRLAGPSALVNELSLSGVPAGWLPEVENAARATANPGAGVQATESGAPVLFHLAADQPLALTIVSTQDRKPAPPPAPSMWQVEAQSLVRCDEGQLLYKTRLRLVADAGSGLTADLTLPAAANIVSITGEDLERWSGAKSEAGEIRRLEIFWKTPDVLRRDLMLNYEVPQTTSMGEWRLVSPQVAAGKGRLRGALYALPMVAEAEFLGENGVPLGAADAQELPRWLAGAIGSANFATINTAKAMPADNAATQVGVRPLPLVRTARATIEESRFQTRLVADGALLCEGTLSVRHDGPLTVSLTLPKDAQLLACAIDRADASPVDRGEGRIDLMVPAEKSTRIDLSYTGRGPVLAPVSGQVSLSLPETDLFVQTLLWDLEIPETYELTAIEGNVALTAGAASPARGGPPVIHLRKDLLKAERPTAELFYQKRAVNP